MIDEEFNAIIEDHKRILKLATEEIEGAKKEFNDIVKDHFNELSR